MGEPPLILLHGWGGDERTLATLAKPLSVQRRVFRLALPGFGKSPEPDEPWATAEYGETIATWLDQRGVRSAGIIGHSHGGRVAIHIAANRPDLVGNLILIGSAGLPPRRSPKIKLRLIYARLLKRMARLVGGEWAKEVETKRAKLGSADWQTASPVMKGTLNRLMREDLTGELRRIQAPTLLVWGSKDTATPLWMGERMKELIGGANLVVIDGAGHYSFLEKPGEVASAIWKHFGLPGAW